MRTSPLPANSIQPSACNPICEKYLTLPRSHRKSINSVRKELGMNEKERVHCYEEVASALLCFM